MEDRLFLPLIILFLSSLKNGSQASKNLALGKHAVQSSTLESSGKFVASRAVDGDLNQDYLKANYCTHTYWVPKQDKAWWRVDLASPSDIKSVTIYYRKNLPSYQATKRLNGFEVIVSTTATFGSKQPCYEDNLGVPYPSDITTVECIDQGQYVTIYNENYVEDNIGPVLELCEVQVFGCETGKYGFQCTQLCPTGCLHSSCDPENGNCRGCETGKYGSQCTQSCSAGCLHSSCDSENGNCGGCKSGWTGPKCDTPCEYQTFGYNCAQTCHCRDGGCNNVNGTCINKGCKAGWKGHDCSTPCSKNTFGPDCAATCHCYLGDCNQTNGRCYYKRCKPGWTTDSCSIECLTPTFGTDCNETCNCETSGCDHIKGICDVPGCKAGWNGTSCNKPCKQDTFGANCDSQCHCLNGTCNRTNGYCDVTGCEAGWSGETCSNACRENTFGKDCKFKCNCKSGGCDRLNGTCKNQVCKDGWKGIRCDEVCDDGNFGFNCNKTCYCAVGSCNHISGKCDTPGCQAGWQGISCSEGLMGTAPSNIDADGANIIGIAIGLVVAIVISAVICGIIVYAFRRKRRNSKAPDEPTVEFGGLVEAGGDEGRQYMNVGQTNEIKPKNTILTPNTTGDDITIYENTKTNSATTIEVDNLKAVILQNKANDEFEKQYKKIPFGPLHPHTAGELEINKPKNRFLTTFPYDHSRVVLNSLAGVPSSDYINASYIDSVNESSHYVATQGPRKNTTDDFWRMVWQIKCGKIVMLTNLIENGKVKCVKYWPEFSKDTIFGDFKITLDTERENIYFSVKELNVAHIKTGEIRCIQHFHFTAWPDHGTPDPIQLMLFHQKFMEIQSDQSGPSVIHCSAGVGRTGTFIALDALYQHGKKTGQIDVSRYVNTMRENRMNMIQTKEQYVVLHEALLETFQFRDTSHKKDAFRDCIYQNDREIKQEYERLKNVKPAFDEKDAYKGAMDKNNHSKNRTNSILPVDRFRPYLMSHESSRTNYINAVILPSFREHVGFLVTQYPLPDTVVDLWCMIYDHDSNTIVTLDKLPKKEKDIEWLPKDSNEFRSGSFTIQQTANSVVCGDTKETELTLCHEETERSLKLFQFQNWDSGNTVPSSTNGIVKLIEIVNNWKLAGEKGPITVICTNGAKCCGVFCLLYNIIQSLQYEDNIDIFQNVRLLQLRRPELISSFEQYQFCYNAVQGYLESANVYVN